MPITVQNNRATRLDTRSVSHPLRALARPSTVNLRLEIDTTLGHTITATTQLHPVSPVPGGEAVIVFPFGPFADGGRPQWCTPARHQRRGGVRRRPTALTISHFGANPKPHGCAELESMLLTRLLRAAQRPSRNWGRGSGCRVGPRIKATPTRATRPPRRGRREERSEELETE